MQKNVMSARGRTILYAVLILFAVIQVYPIIWVILQSIKTTEELTNLSALSLPSSLYTGHFSPMPTSISAAASRLPFCSFW